MALIIWSLLSRLPSSSRRIKSSSPFSLAIAISSSLDNASSSSIVKPPVWSIATKVSSPLNIATSVASSDGLIKSKNLSPSSDMFVVAHELRKITLDNNRIFFDIL